MIYPPSSAHPAVGSTTNQWADASARIYSFEEPEDLKNIGVLQAAYDSLYAPVFSLDHGGEPLEKWTAELDPQRQDRRFIVYVASQAINGQDVPVGISVGAYYPQTQTAILAYNVVSSDARGAGIGKKLVKARMDGFEKLARQAGTPLRAVFIECNNPALVAPENDVLDPAARVRIFEKMGAKAIEIDFVCPINDKIYDLMILGMPHPVHGKYPTADETKLFLGSYYKAFGFETPESDPDFRAMSQQLDRISREGLPLYRHPFGSSHAGNPKARP